MPIQQAQQLGRYYLLDRVAFGGMAEIFRAKTRDAQGKELLVAVKRVLAHLCEDDEFIQMLIDEARLTALLKHNNIARVYEFSKVGSEYFIAMEYVEGRTLHDVLEAVSYTHLDVYKRQGRAPARAATPTSRW